MKTITIELDAIEAERLEHFKKLYDGAMTSPIPDLFNDMVQWAYHRQAAQAEFARFMRALLGKTNQ